MTEDDETHLNKTQARGGSTTGFMRTVLVASLVLIIVIFGAMLLIGQQ